MTPAVARDSIAADPISSKLSMRNSSPKPSRRLSNIDVDRFVRRVALGDAGAAGRDDRARACRARSRRARASLHLRRLVADDVRDRRRCGRPASSSSAIVRPLVSVSSVRVSLTVSTKHGTWRATGRGARRRTRDQQSIHGGAEGYLRMKLLTSSPAMIVHVTNAVGYVLCCRCRRAVGGRVVRPRRRCPGHARQGRREVGRRHVQEDDARRQGRAARRVVGINSTYLADRHRRVRCSSRRRSRTLRLGGSIVFGGAERGAGGAAQQHLRHGDSRPAAGGGVAAEPPADASAMPLLNDRRLRSRRRLPHRRARRRFRARWRSARPATSSSRSRPRASPRSKRARSAST